MLSNETDGASAAGRAGKVSDVGMTVGRGGKTGASRSAARRRTASPHPPVVRAVSRGSRQRRRGAPAGGGPKKGSRWGRVAPLLLALSLLAAMLVGGVLAAPAPQGAVTGPVAVDVPPDEPLVDATGVVVGHHYRQTGSGTGAGYDLREPFYSTAAEQGGVSVVGYPASAPFRRSDGCTYQVFQVLLLQACPGEPVRLANTFQILEEAGADPQLEALGIGRGQADGAASFAEAVRIRLGWLEEAPIRERYLAQCGGGDAGAAVQRCGLPMHLPQHVGPFVSQRFQRIAYQRWLSDGPGGIRAGDVTAVLGGDLLKATGVVSGPAVQPHPLGRPPVLELLTFSPALTTGTQTGVTAPAPGDVVFRDRATLSVLRTLVETAPAADAGGFRPARDGEDLTVGDAVRTDASGQALLTFYEGTTAEVLPASLLVVERLGTNATGGNPPAPLISLRQLAGQVIHRLTRTLLPGAVYEVQTPSASAVVRGTVLRITVAADGGTRVEVFRGSADVTGAGVTVAVPAGTVTDVAPGQPPVPPAPNSTPPDVPPALDAPLIPPAGPPAGVSAAVPPLTPAGLSTPGAGIPAVTEGTAVPGAVGAVATAVPGAGGAVATVEGAATAVAGAPGTLPVATPPVPVALPGSGTAVPGAPTVPSVAGAIGNLGATAVPGTSGISGATGGTRASGATATRTPTPTPGTSPPGLAVASVARGIGASRAAEAPGASQR